MEPQATTPHKYRRLLVIGGVVVGLLTIIGLTLLLSGDKKAPEPLKATVTIEYNVTDSADVVVRFNGKEANRDQAPTYQVTAGEQTLTISKANYADFSAHFSVGADQLVLINAVLKATNLPTVDGPQDLTLYPGMSDAKITDTQYFEDSTWAVVTISAEDYEGAVVVLQYNAATDSWTTLAGPADVFQPQDVSWLPSSVQSYLSDHSHIARGE